MAKFSGGYGGAPNMQQIMRQAQKMQQDLQKAQEELADTEVVATSGGGMVEVVMTCDKQLVSLTIKPEAVDPEDVEMLEDMIIAGVNEALKSVDEEREKLLGPLTGGAGGLL